METMETRTRRSVVTAQSRNGTPLPTFIVTARCGHKWVTSGPFAETDLCVTIERMLNHHESLCSPDRVHRPGW